MYKIVRHYERDAPEDVAFDYTLEEAQEHCKDPETSSSTCTSWEGKRRTSMCGKWFEGYTEQR